MTRALVLNESMFVYAFKNLDSDSTLTYISSIEGKKICVLKFIRNSSIFMTLKRWEFIITNIHLVTIMCCVFLTIHSFCPFWPYWYSSSLQSREVKATHKETVRLLSLFWSIFLNYSLSVLQKNYLHCKCCLVVISIIL